MFWTCEKEGTTQEGPGHGLDLSSTQDVWANGPEPALYPSDYVVFGGNFSSSADIILGERLVILISRDESASVWAVPTGKTTLGHSVGAVV